MDLRWTRQLLVAAAALGVGATRAQAQNLVTNGGFESGLTGWTVTLCNSSYHVTTDGTAHSGTSAAAFPSVGCYDTITQTLSTTPGEQYMIDFWAQESGSPNGLRILFGPNTIFEQALTNSSYQEFTLTATATSNSTDFSIEGFNNPSRSHVDDVSVTANVTATPEPATLVLMASGLVPLVGFTRRRSKRA